MGKRTNENGVYWRFLDDCAAQIIRAHYLRNNTWEGAARSLELSPDQLRKVVRRLQARGLLTEFARTPPPAAAAESAEVDDSDDDDAETPTISEDEITDV